MACVNINDKKDPHERLDGIISTDDRIITNKRYNTWAANYEDDMKAVKYFGAEGLVKYFDQLNIPKDAKILDVCSGPGGIGRELAKRGYSDIHAIDGAENLLAKAKEEGNYKSYNHLLFEPDSKLPYENDTFDVVMLAGTFAPGHLPIVALREVCRVTKKDGVDIWICCDPVYYEDKDKQYADGAFYKVIEELRNKGYWKEHEGFPMRIPYIEYSDGFVMAFDKIASHSS